MLLLALDTSTRQSSIALCTEDELYGEYTWNVGNNHSVELLENIQRMMAECQMSLSQIDGVVVATGPGSFNGVRVALATAKALTFALKKTLIGVSTLEIIAAQQQQAKGPVCAILEAGRGELYAACYLFEELRNDGGETTYHMKRLGEELLCTPQRLAEHLKEQANEWFGVPGERKLPPYLFCGEISQKVRLDLVERMGEKSLFRGKIASARRAAELARLGMQRIEAGETDDPLLLEAHYLRRPSITTSTRKQPLLGEAAQRPTGQHTTEREEGALRH